MASITKRGKNWYVRFRHAGKEHWESAGPEKRSAERLLAKRITEIAEGRFLDKRKRCTVTFQEFAPRFLEWSKANKRSWKRDRLCVRNLSVRFAGELLSKITLPAVEQYRQARLSGEISFSNKSVTRRTVNIEVKCLHRMLNLATAWGELERNPISGIRMLPEKCSPTRYLSTGEIRRLLEACPQHLQGPVRLALATGMRRQEVIGLTWAEVDRRLGLIHLAPERCKSGRGRTIPLAPDAREVLRVAWQKRADDCELVFHRQGKTLGDPKRAFATACRKAGLHDVTFHTLRHTWASHAVMAGAPLPAVQAVLGHSTITVTMRYAHLAPNTLAAAVRAAGRSMQGDHGGERLELTDTTGKGCESAAHGSKTGEAGLLDLEIV